MKIGRQLSASGVASSLFEGVIRSMVGCFVLIVAISVLIGLLGYFSANPFGAKPPRLGPRVPIPNVDAGTLAAGQSIYLRENCGACHTLTSTDPRHSANPRHSKDGDAGVSIQASNGVPNLTHEGRRNADIGWQITNLREHRRIYPDSMMGNYTDLSPSELKAIASYLATRR